VRSLSGPPFVPPGAPAIEKSSLVFLGSYYDFSVMLRFPFPLISSRPLILARREPPRRILAHISDPLSPLTPAFCGSSSPYPVAVLGYVFDKSALPCSPRRAALLLFSRTFLPFVRLLSLNSPLLYDSLRDLTAAILHLFRLRGFELLCFSP